MRYEVKALRGSEGLSASGLEAVDCNNAMDSIGPLTGGIAVLTHFPVFEFAGSVQ